MLNLNLSKELALKYSFETFDFKTKSPEDFVLYYQEIYNKINTLISEHDKKIINESYKLFGKSNF